MSGARHHGPPGDHTASRAPDGVPLHYARHRPERTTLYRLVQRHAADFIAHTEASTGSRLPRFVKDEFDAFLQCGILAHGFLRLRCGECGHDTLLAFSCKRRGFCPSCGARRMSQTAAQLVDHVIPHVPVRQWVLSLPIPLRLLLAAQPELITPVLGVVQRVLERHLRDAAGLGGGEGQGGAVTLIQRFGSAANLNIHLHCLVLDGVYRSDAEGVAEFIEAAAPTEAQLHALLHTVIARLMKMLTRRGVLVEETDRRWLAEPDAEGEEARTLRPLQAAPITYRIAVGPRAGQKVLTLRGAMPREVNARQPPCADIDGFSLHAAVRIEAHERKRLERLCRYITRRALSDERVQLDAAGQVETAIAGRNRMMRHMAIEAIRQDPAWRGGDYDRPPVQGLRGAVQVLLVMGSSPLQMQQAAPTRQQAERYADDYLARVIARTDANDAIYQWEASRNYDPRGVLDRIRVPVRFVNSADDYVNPPELGLAEELTKRMPRAKFVLLPITPATRGHGTHTHAALWKQHLVELLRESERPAPAASRRDALRTAPSP